MEEADDDQKKIVISIEDQVQETVRMQEKEEDRHDKALLELYDENDRLKQLIEDFNVDSEKQIIEINSNFEQTLENLRQEHKKKFLDMQKKYKMAIFNLKIDQKKFKEMLYQIKTDNEYDLNYTKDN